MQRNLVYPIRAKDLLPPNFGIWLLVTLHLVGGFGFAFGVTNFERLVPFHLMVTFAIWLFNQERIDRRLGVWLVAAGMFGFAVEVLGVRTAKIFGDYQYGPTLGPSALGVPLIIGLNWCLLLAVSGYLAEGFGAGRKWNFVARAGFGAALLVVLDLAIEPFAVTYGLWQWEGGRIPLQNYVAWWAVSFVLLLPYHYARLGTQNNSAAWIYVCQLVFFCSTSLF